MTNTHKNPETESGAESVAAAMPAVATTHLPLVVLALWTLMVSSFIYYLVRFALPDAQTWLP